MKQILIIGASHESINTAIWLASIQQSVMLLADADEIDNTLVHYKFDQQMSALWQMYVSIDKIRVVDSCADSLAVDVLWAFVDVMGELGQAAFQQLSDSVPQVLLSGSLPIGEMQALADDFSTDCVCYVPFVFMKDGAGFMSIAQPELLLIGEKAVGVHRENALLLTLLSRALSQYISDIQTVEFARSAIMGMLATRLSYMNELARLADATGVDIAQVQAMLGLDKRIGQQYLSAGWGFGGQTLPTETALLDAFFIKNQVSSQLLDTVCSINEDQKELIFRKFWRYFDGFIDKKTVTIWGAGYRVGTGRTINSAIHPLLRLLWSYQIQTHIYAPNAGFELNELYGDEPLFSLIDDGYALMDSDALFILNWSDVVLPDVALLNEFALPIFDAKNIFTDAMIASYTGDYHGIGRNKHHVGA